MIDERSEIISVVVPGFNEADNLPALRDRLDKVLAGLPEYKFEIIYIDNCSNDRSFSIAESFAHEDPRWRCYRFSRNFGAEASLAAGIKLARGHAVVFLFSDLQEPPEVIPKMIALWKEGNDVVYGVLRNRADRSWFVRIGSRIAYKIIEMGSDIRIPRDATDFRLLSRRAADAVLRCSEHNRYLRGLIHWIGFKQVAVEYDRSPRQAGRSSTNMSFLFAYSFNALVAFSSKPLVLASYLGALATLLSMIGGVLYGVLFLLARNGLVSLTPPPAGWTTQMLVILFFGGARCLFLGIIGKYLSNVYDETKNRPLYIIADQPAADPLALGGER